VPSANPDTAQAPKTCTVELDAEKDYFNPALVQSRFFYSNLARTASRAILPDLKACRNGS
jgi:hypothetical protein